MKHTLLNLIGLLVVLVLAIPSSMLIAQRPVEEGNMAGAKHEPLAESGLAQFVIELQDDPTVVTWAAAQAQHGEPIAPAASLAQAQLARINEAQATLATSLAALGAQELYRTQRVYNGIAVVADASKVAEIEKLPGVKAVHPLVLHELDNSTGVPLIGAPDVWKMLDLAGVPFTGKGIKVGIIDTGIDYMHTDLGGPGVSYSPTGTLWISRTFPTAKVVGGWDFAGDNYNAGGSGSQLIPAPDPDPMDCHSHGTHVAGTAAGYGVNADGTTFMGPYTGTLNFDDFRVGPGVAPEASLYALRVFGCAGSTALTAQAIEWAVDPNKDGDFSDHLDVINMSLGSGFGSLNDTSAVASDNAVLAGVIVVASSGNSGDTYYISGSPGIAGRVLSVAASNKEGATLDGFRVNPPSAIAGVHGGSESVAYNWLTTTLPITRNLVYPLAGADPARDQRTGCYTFDITNTNIISGNFVLIDWTEPSCGGSVARAANAVAAGAKGVLIADDTQIFDLSITGSSVVPALSIPKSIGDQLKTNLPLSMTFSHEYARSILYKDPAIVDIVAGFSSRGPRRGDSALKPDITAPGVNVFSAAYGTGTRGSSKNGTSMAAPHAAGVMALLRQINPLWTVEELKALAMNTALHDVRAGVPLTSTLYGLGRVGAGRVDMKNASQSQVVAYNAGAPGLVSVSFGAPEVLATTTAVRNVKVVNKGGTAMTYAVAFTNTLPMPGVSFSVSPASINVPAYGAATVAVTMTANATLMKHSHDAAISEAGPRHWLSEAGGYVTLTPTSGQPLRLPVYAAPRPASDMKALQTSLSFGASPVISLTGQGLNTAGLGTAVLPYDEISVVTAFELAEKSPNDSTSSGVVNNADLKYLGVTSDYKATNNIISTTVFFGVATWGNWSSPTEGTRFTVYIDTTGDGVADYRLYNYNLGQAGGGDPNDVFISRLVRASTGAQVAAYYLNGVPAAPMGPYLGLDTVPYNTNVMALPVMARDLGFTNTAKFSYWVTTSSRDSTLATEDTSAAHTYDAANPGLDLNNPAIGVPGWFDLPGSAIAVRYNSLSAYVAASSQGVLLLHHHNTTGKHDEVLNVTFNKIYLPVVIK